MAKYTLVKHFWMACAHAVHGAGKCERIHGHNFKITFCIEGRQLNEHGLLIDFREVKHALEKKYDHRLLNDFPEFDPERGGINPSTERMAEVFYHHIKALCAEKPNKPVLKWVEVQETNEAYARYEEE